MVGLLVEVEQTVAADVVDLDAVDSEVDIAGQEIVAVELVLEFELTEFVVVDILDEVAVAGIEVELAFVVDIVVEVDRFEVEDSLIDVELGSDSAMVVVQHIYPVSDQMI